MTQAIIGVDWDDVIFDFNRRFIPYANSVLGTSVTYETHHSFEFNKVYGVPNREMLIHVERFCHNHRLHGTISPVMGSFVGLTELAKIARLPIITSRCETLRGVTQELSYTHGFAMLDTFHFTNSTSRKYRNQRRKKSEVCRELGVQVFVDDALHNAEDISAAGIPVILMDRPWNENRSLPDNVHRAGNWREGKWGWEDVPDLVRSLIR